MEYHPIFQALGERPIFYRTYLTFDEHEHKHFFDPEKRRGYTTAYRAIAEKWPQPWDAPQTANPLILSDQKYILLIDMDGACSDLVAEAQERIQTCWHYSHSGIGRHALAFTELSHINEKPRPIIWINETKTEKIELFLGNQNAILTNQHTQLLPMKNCDQEILSWWDDLSNRYKDFNIIDSNIKRICFWSNGIVFPPECFPSFLMAYASERGYLSAPKRELLRYIWNAPKDPYWHGWIQFHAEKIATEKFHITPRQMSKHLSELHEHGWIDRKYKPYGEYKRLLSVRLNVDEQFFQVGQGDRE